MNYLSACVSESGTSVGTAISSKAPFRSSLFMRSAVLCHEVMTFVKHSKYSAYFKRGFGGGAGVVCVAADKQRQECERRTEARVCFSPALQSQGNTI